VSGQNPTTLAKTSANPSGQKQFPLSTVGALVVNYRGQVLIVKTTKWRGTWGVPGGKVEWGETRFFTALYPETIPSTLSKEFIVCSNPVEYPPDRTSEILARFISPQHRSKPKTPIWENLHNLRTQLSISSNWC
jgi:hypothetical protein